MLFIILMILQSKFVITLLNDLTTSIICSCYDDTSCIERVQAIQHLHQVGNKWDDIGYHFLVGENGKVYEGRGWNRQAAHSPGWNSDSYGNAIVLSRIFNTYSLS